MDEEILKELRDVERKFSNEEYVLDRTVIFNTQSLEAKRFDTRFPEIMALFRRLDLDKDRRYTDYFDTCNEFHSLLMIGKALNVIVKKATQQELNKYKDRCHFLESKEKEYESTLHQKQDELTTLKTKINVACKQHNFLKAYFEDVETEVEEKHE